MWWRSLTPNHWFVFVVASLAWLFDCLDAQFFNLARDGAMEDILQDKSQATILAPYTTSIFLLGWAVGGVILGSMGDRFGRARSLTASIFIYSISTGLSSFSTGFLDFCVYRFITGFGVGGVFGLAVALVADTVDDEARPATLGLLQSLSTWGNIAAGFIGMAIGAAASRQLLPFQLKPWQMLFLVGGLPALLCVVIMRKLKEPEKWIRARDDGIKRGQKLGSYVTLLRHPTWRKHALLGLIACSSGIIGLWGIGNFHPQIVGSIIEQELASRHLSSERMASEKAFWRSTGLLLQNIGGFLGMMALSKFAQVKGRRPAFALALVLSFLSTVLVFKFMRQTSDMYWMLPIMGFGQLSVFAVFAIYLPELFPTSLRSTGTSCCYNAGRVIAATAPFTISRMTAALGGNIEGFRTAGLWVSLLLLVGLFVLPFLPETKGLPLPEDK